MNLNIKTGTVGYKNKILVSIGKFSLGKNKVNAFNVKTCYFQRNHVKS